MNWPFGRAHSAKKKEAKKEKEPPPREKDIPPDEERRGPLPPPPRTAHAPGVSLYSFNSIPSQSLLRFGEGYGGFFLEGEEGVGGRRSATLLVLTGGGATSDITPAPSPGDVLIWTTAAFAAQSPPGESSISLPLEEISKTSPKPHRHIRRDDLGGRAVPGITGLKTLVNLPEEHLAVLRLGPPPTARWAFRGVRAIAVFSGRITLVDGEEAKLVRAGSLALVGDPSATLYFEAGNDAALAVALATSAFVAALS